LQKEVSEYVSKSGINRAGIFRHISILLMLPNETKDGCTFARMLSK
jgi:hypothetical protein